MSRSDAVGRHNRTVKVLIVDDSLTMRAMLSSIFSDQAGFALVGLAKDAREALASVKSAAPDIVVIDLCMPYIGGSELLSMLADYSDVRKVILTASANLSGGIRQRLSELGASAFFDKTEVARNPLAFRNELRRIAKLENSSSTSHRPAVELQSDSNIIFAANRFPIPRDELARIRVIAEMNIANLSIDPALDIIVRHLAKAIDYPLIAVNLIDADKVWAKAAVGFERQAFQRGESFCTHALCQEGPLIVADATAHPVFRTLPAVTGGFQVRSYVGVPIVSNDGVTLGMVCASDKRPRRPSKSELSRLTDTAQLVAAFLDNTARRHAA